MPRIPIESTIDTKTLFKRVAEGDEHAFQLIFDAYKNIFYAAAYKMTNDNSAAEEIVQEVFINLWVKRHLVARAKQIDAYLFGILHNVVYQHFRRQAKVFRLKRELAIRQDTSEDSIEQLLLDKEMRQVFESVIDQLPSQQKLVFRMAKQDELSREEIAKKLNLSPNTVRNHLAAAMDFLNRHLWKSVFCLLFAIILMCS